MQRSCDTYAQANFSIFVVVNIVYKKVIHYKKVIIVVLVNKKGAKTF